MLSNARKEAPIRYAAELRRKILSRQASVGVVGQGYVGLSVACGAAEVGFPVMGLDVDSGRIDQLRRGVLAVPGVSEDAFRTGSRSGRLAFTTDTACLSECRLILICVPTPVQDHAPDLSYIEGACKDVARHLSPESLVILESTTYPGTTEEVVVPILESSGLAAGRDFLVAYSPERIDPGNEIFGLKNTPRVVGGCTPEATALAALFYSQVVERVVTVSSCRAAELAKLLENTYRHVNIALVNEMAMLCHEMDMDIWEVVEAAATKPFGFAPFYPGPGVGGHCIPLDPTYLAWLVRRDVGHQFRMVEQAQDINAQMPSYVVSRVAEALNRVGKAVKGSRILVLGVSYKPNVGDVRESPALKVMAVLARQGAKVTFHDPYLESIVVGGNFLERTELTDSVLEASDCVALLTPHGAYDLDWVAGCAKLVFDAKNAYRREAPNVVRL